MSARLADIDCAACPHVLQVHDGPDVNRLTNVRPCVRNMLPSCTGRTAWLFFRLEAHGPQGAAGYVAALEPTSTERRDPEP
jgi:hypothetical protein